MTSAAAAPSPQDAARVEDFESRWEAAPAVVAVMVLQLATALASRVGHWTLWFVPWWAWLTPLVSEAVLIVPLVVDRWRHRLERLGHRKRTVRMLFGVVSLANLLLLVAVLGSLLSGQEHSGGQLLAKALTVWTTNAITFGLWFWSIDRGGPAQRLAANPPAPDFLFPQLSDPEHAEPGWYPRLLDYLYVGFTNSIAFSPTDTLPLTRTAKLLMLGESAVSAVTLLLVAARAVNILG